MSEYIYNPPENQLQTRRTAPLVIGAPQIGLVLDRSESMKSIRAEAIVGVNSLLTEQQEKSADSRFSMTLFNDRVSIVHEAVPIRDVPALTQATYTPQGGTALNDGIGAMMQSIGKHASRLTPVLIAVVTDGDENSSRQFTLPDIRQMLGYRQEIHGWAFVFLGPAGALHYARSIGIPEENFISFTASAAGITTILARLSQAMSAYRLGDRQYMLQLKGRE
jgi:von Willebrand factor type A domain